MSDRPNAIGILSMWHITNTTPVAKWPVSSFLVIWLPHLLGSYGSPFGRLESDKLVIESRHKGEMHVNEFSVGAQGTLGDVARLKHL